MRHAVFTALCCLMIYGCGNAMQVLDFEGLPDYYYYYGGNENIDGYYPGVEFGPHAVILDSVIYGYNSEGYPPHSGNCVLGTIGTSYTRVDFSIHTNHVGMWYTSYFTFHVEAYDGNDSLLVSASAPANYGSTDFVEVNSVGIAYVIYHNSGDLFVIDDFEYEDEPCCLDIDMEPDEDPVIVSPGDSFWFTGSILNMCVYPVVTDIWLMVDIPGYGMYGPLARNLNQTVEPGQTLTRRMAQEVPLEARPGAYSYVAYCGDFPNYLCDGTSFPFTIVEGISAGGGGTWFNKSAFDFQSSPDKSSLMVSYPNPFNARTNFQFNLSSECYARLEIYNLLGQRIAVLVDENLNAGEYSVQWDAGGFPSGIYLARLYEDEKTTTIRLSLIK